jgi:hypothetical protein
VHLDRHGGARGERVERRHQAALGEQGRMDPARELAQFAEAGVELGARGGERHRRGAVRRQRALRGGQHHRRDHEPLLRPVVQVALDPVAGRVGGRHDPGARGLELLNPGGSRLLLEPQLLGRAALRDVEDDPVEPAGAVAVGGLDAALERPADRAVAVHHAVFQVERPLLGDRRRDLAIDRRKVVGMGDVLEAHPARVDEVLGGVARDGLDLGAHALHLPEVIGIRAIDRARDALHQGAQQALRVEAGRRRRHGATLTDGGAQRRTVRSSAMDDELNLIKPDEIAYRLELTPAELKVTYNALKVLLDDFGHDEHDVQRIIRGVIDKLPPPQSVESIDLNLPRGRPRL